jgi:rRNA maturation endonuclease Nob1
MKSKSILSEKHDMGEVIPVIENWLSENGYSVTVLANRIDAENVDTKVRIFFDDYSAGCLIKIYSNPTFFDQLKRFLAQKKLLTYRISCSYCNREIEVSQTQCPYCGAPNK